MRRLRKIAKELGLLALMVLGVLAARSSLADHYLVPSSSMQRNLLPGDHVIADKTAYGLRIPFLGLRVREGERPGRGEVVIFDSPADGTRLIKRIVAVGGDRVELRGGRLRINGEPLGGETPPFVERFGERAVEIDLSFGGGPDLAPTRVPEGSVLVLGDSRGNSRDGRFFGFIPADSIYARAHGVFFRRGHGFVWKPL